MLCRYNNYCQRIRIKISLGINKTEIMEDKITAEDMIKRLGLEKKPKLTLCGVMWRLFGWLYPKCLHCKKGRLYKIDTYHYKPEMDIDIYKCNKCGNREGVNAS